MKIHSNLQIRSAWMALVVITAVSSSAIAQENRPRVRGIVLSIASDMKSFTVVDRGGTLVPVNVTSNTQYQNGQVRLNDVVKFGMDVRVQFAADGTAERVFSRGMADQIEFEQLQPFMQCTDQEWAVLRPKIDRVRELIRQADGDVSDPNDNNNGDNSAPQRPQHNGVHDLQRTLQATFFDQNATVEKLNVNLTSLRQARTKARADLAQARKELTELVTARQESLLVIMGILE
jgi:hypothetical protein